MRKTIKSLEEEIKNKDRDIQWYKDIVESIRLAVFPNTTSYARPIKDIPAEIIRLTSFRAFNEGIIRQKDETIHLLKQIIRWQIKPDTAMESKVQDKINDFRN